VIFAARRPLGSKPAETGVTGVCNTCRRHAAPRFCRRSGRRLLNTSPTRGRLYRSRSTLAYIFDASAWESVTDEFDDVTYHRAVDVPAVRIAFDRPAVRNAFRPGTVDELYAALDHARKQADVGCVLLTGNGPAASDGGWAFSAGGDQSVRGESGYEYREDDDADASDDPLVREARAGRLHILEVQRLIRFMPKPVVAVVPGWAVGGGHSLHVVCDLTLASEEHAKFLQTDPDVASFDGGFGSAYLAKQIGQKRAREVFFRGKTYSADGHGERGRRPRRARDGRA